MCYCTPNNRTPVCANCAQWLAEENAKLREELGDGTTGNKYRAELYDEVWNTAKSMGFANVTDALVEYAKLREQLEAWRDAADRSQMPAEFYKDYSEGTMRAMQALLTKERERAEAAEAMSVAKILKCIDPDRDVYFRSVADVKETLSKQYEELEDYELGIKVAPCIQQKLEAAEAKLKAASEQEPLLYAYYDEDGDICVIGFNTYSETKDKSVFGETKALYSAPIPPADVQELQREVARLNAGWQNANADALSDKLAADTNSHIQAERIAELGRKLAEQQASILECGGTCGCGTDALSDYVAQAREEGRKEAIPEIANIREVDLRGDFAVKLVFNSCRSASTFADEILAAMHRPQHEVEP